MSVTTASGLDGRKRSTMFSSSGTWTVPAGVFWAEAEVVGGGAGRADDSVGVAGTDSSVAFGGQTITGPGQAGAPVGNVEQRRLSAAGANSGAAAALGAAGNEMYPNGSYSGHVETDEPPIVVMRGQASVTPGSAVTVTVGAGGVSTANGGSGYAIIRYEV